MTMTSTATYEQRWVEALNRGDLSGADEAFDANCTVHMIGVPDAMRGLDAWKGYVGAILTAFPDIQFTIDKEFRQGDTSACRWHATGTHTGPLGELPATGKRVTITGMLIDTLREGKVVERWEMFDQPSMMRQLGVG